MGLPPAVHSPNQPSNALQAWGSRSSGRAIFANGSHQQLLDNFRQLSSRQSSEGYHAQTLIKAVESLRGPASPVNSMLKPNQPTRRLLVAGGFEIEYELNSYYGDCQTDVEIVDIRLAAKDAREERRPALWRVKHRSGDQWMQDGADPMPQLAPTPKMAGKKASPLKVGVNGHSSDLLHAAATLGEHMARGEDGKRANLENTGFQLLYVPSGSSALVSEWVPIKSLGLNGTDEQRQASRVLAQHMYEAHKKQLYVEWTAHKHGAWVLTEAMQQLERKKVNLEERQKIFLSDASASHVVADRVRQSINMDTKDNTWHNTAPGPAQVIGGLHFGVAPLLCLADELRHRTEKDELLGKGGDLLWQTGTKGLFITGAATAMISTAGIPGSLAILGASILIASLPGARESYYKNPGHQFGVWLNRFRKRS
ncbi:hypothetical protein [Microbulbifer hydrolyticus]|uniref:Uncharacterized protein n=1 Tax=Microbulbifer hydrolyticus TaxID=48074 RepID=A0A6P1TDS9_9GAMM|nr:hypothetical protein [Microbulbifer hydrolyticus]MBB5212123.1 hypothetical protein [Microbulbifer hydrolyticus]QHQ39796.1 hypothetical protein GTQ55_12910 [Microbulbifer hydrolyticus]